MRNYLATLLGTCATCMVVVAGVNWFIDVNGVYHPAERTKFSSEYIAALSASRIGLVFSPYERSVKLALLRRTNAECYITGSSHEMQLTLGNFAPATPGCHSFVNLAVSGASFEDLITHIGELAEHTGVHTVYIGIGPWMLRHGADQRWTEERPALERACAVLGLASTSYRLTVLDQLRLVRNAINGEYLTRNLQTLLNRRPTIVAADRREYSDAVLRPDGSFQYSPQFLSRNSPARQAVGGGSYKIARPYVDPMVVEDLTIALKVLAHRDVHVVFLFMPYHPEVMSCRSADVCASMAAVVRSVQVLAGRVGGDVIGSYHPAVSGLSWRDFYDDMHVSAEALNRLQWPSRAAELNAAPADAQSLDAP